MTTTKEDRIKAEYRARKKRLDYTREGLPTLRMQMARKHKISIVELRRICGLRPKEGAQ